MTSNVQCGTTILSIYTGVYNYYYNIIVITPIANYSLQYIQMDFTSPHRLPRSHGAAPGLSHWFDSRLAAIGVGAPPVIELLV